MQTFDGPFGPIGVPQFVVNEKPQMNSFLLITTLDNITKIENRSNLKVLLYQIPEKPKRKYTFIYMIPPGEFRLLDHPNLIALDFTKISIRFEE